MKNKQNNDSDVFNLEFLGLGQHVTFRVNQPIQQDVEHTICAMKNAFDKQPSPTTLPPDLSFDENSKWLIGFQFKLLDFINISAIFNDPGLYGLLITLTGEKADNLDGFKLEIDYEKISDSLGSYKGKLALPEEARRYEFGTGTVIVPECYIEIYTNGDFKVDVGFPTNLDFSRSLTIEVFPYIGSGGFYFARLSPGTSTRIPSCTNNKNSFSPIIEFGMGMQLGVGKSIDKGILKAGLSLTFLGILEGTLAFYNPEPGEEGKGTRYHWLQGAFGVAGKLYGEVDLSIVSARVDALIQAVARITLEAYRSTPIIVEAEVSARAEVVVGFGPIRKRISKSFNEKVQADFLIGENSTAPWDNCSLPAVKIKPKPMKWQPLLLDKSEKKELTLHFIPHVTIADDTVEDIMNSAHQVKYAAMMYIESRNAENSSREISFENLIEAILIWTINAYVNSNRDNTTIQQARDSWVSAQDLCTIHAYLSGSGELQTSIDYRNKEGEDIVSFLSEYFNINVCHPNVSNTCEVSEDELPVSFFPIIPDLELVVNHVKHNPDSSRQVHRANFEAYNRVCRGYLEDVKCYIQKMSVSYQDELEQAHDKRYVQEGSCDKNEKLSIATWCFQDCFTLKAKAAIKEAMEAFEEIIGKEIECEATTDQERQVRVEVLIDKVLERKKEKDKDRVMKIAAMTSRYMLHGMNVPGPDLTKYNAETPIYPIYELTGQQFTIPELESNDDLILTLKNSGDLKVTFKPCPSEQNDQQEPNLEVKVPECEIERIERLKNVTLNKLGQVKLLETCSEVKQTYTVKNPITWNNNQKVWFFSESLNKNLEKTSETLPYLVLKKVNQSGQCEEIYDYNLATKIEVDIRKIKELTSNKGTFDNEKANIFHDVVGTDEIGKTYLERLITTLRCDNEDRLEIIESIHLLYSSSKEGGLISHANAEVKLVMTNLSTETNPEDEELLDDECEKSENEKFIEWLFQGSLVRSGGCHLYYCHGNEKDNIQGLPNDTDKVSIFIKYEKGVSPSSFMNCVVLEEKVNKKITEEQDSLFFEDQNFKTKVPVIPPGHIGFEVTREAPRYNNEVDDYIQQQFNLIGFKLCENDWFYGQPQNPLPIGSTYKYPKFPCENELWEELQPVQSPKEWYYQAVLPVAKFSKVADKPCDSLSEKDCGSALKEVWNPYAGIGGNAKIKFHFQDLFGNCLYLPDDSVDCYEFPIQYRDFLIPFHQWPGTKVEYEFSKDKELHIKFGFDSSKYTCDKKTEQCKGKYKKVQENRTIAKRTYERVYFQLLKEDVQVFFNSSMTGNKDNPIGLKIIVDKNQMIEFVDDILNFLDGETDDTPDIGKVIREKICMDNPEMIFELTLHLTIERTNCDHIDSNFEDVDAVRWVTTKVWPKAVQEDLLNVDNGPKHSLYGFAKNFEDTFYGKIALGSSGENANEQGDNKRIWVVNFDKKEKENWHYEIHKDSYIFARVPMSNSKYPYKEELVDLDKWEKECLTYFEELLAPKYALTAYKVDEGKTLDRILNAKKTIANAIAQTVTHVGNLKEECSSCYSFKEAREKFRQQLLIKLSNACEIDFVVQHPVDVYSPYEEDEDNGTFVPRLYGTIVGSNLTSYWLHDKKLGANENQEYSFSTAKIPLKKGTSWLTYLFSTKQGGKYRKYKFEKAAYQVSHIEHQIHAVPGMEGYKASSWLSFVIPWDDKAVGRNRCDEIETENESVEIPILLRSYPTPPDLKVHQTVYNPGQPTKLMDTRYWDYEYTYEPTLEAQDRIKTKIVLNVKKKKKNYTDLLDILVESLDQFRSAYSHIKSDLDKVLSAADTSECPTFKGAEDPIQKFWECVNNMAIAWKQWAESINQSQLNQATEGQIELSYDIVEYSEQTNDENSPLLIKVTHQEGYKQENCISLPWMKIEGYETEKVETGELNSITYKFYLCQDDKEVEGKTCRNKNYLTYEGKKKISKRTVSLQKLDILNIQHAWAGVYLTRNEGLFEDFDNCVYKSTNEKFVYQTPLVKFESQITPFLVNEDPIDIAALKGESQMKNLEEHLTSMLEELLKYRESKEHTIRGWVGYRFNLYGGRLHSAQGKAPIVPTFLTLPFQFKDNHENDNNEVIKDLSTKILSIFERPDRPDPSVGMFVFQLGVYTPTQNEEIENKLPILQLRNLHLELNKISDLKGF